MLGRAHGVAVRERVGQAPRRGHRRRRLQGGGEHRPEAAQPVPHVQRRRARPLARRVPPHAPHAETRLRAPGPGRGPRARPHRRHDVVRGGGAERAQEGPPRADPVPGRREGARVRDAPRRRLPLPRRRAPRRGRHHQAGRLRRAPRGLPHERRRRERVRVRPRPRAPGHELARVQDVAPVAPLALRERRGDDLHAGHAGQQQAQLRHPLPRAPLPLAHAVARAVPGLLALGDDGDDPRRREVGQAQRRGPRGHRAGLPAAARQPEFRLHDAAPRRPRGDEPRAHGLRRRRLRQDEGGHGRRGPRRRRAPRLPPLPRAAAREARRLRRRRREEGGRGRGRALPRRAVLRAAPGPRGPALAPRDDAVVLRRGAGRRQARRRAGLAPLRAVEPRHDVGAAALRVDVRRRALVERRAGRRARRRGGQDVRRDVADVHALRAHRRARDARGHPRRRRRSAGAPRGAAAPGLRAGGPAEALEEQQPPRERARRRRPHERLGAAARAEPLHGHELSSRPPRSRRRGPGRLRRALREPPGPRGREPAGAGHAAARGHRLPARARARLVRGAADGLGDAPRRAPGRVRRAPGQGVGHGARGAERAARRRERRDLGRDGSRRVRRRRRDRSGDDAARGDPAPAPEERARGRARRRGGRARAPLPGEGPGPEIQHREDAGPEGHDQAVQRRAAQEPEGQQRCPSPAQGGRAPGPAARRHRRGARGRRRRGARPRRRDPHHGRRARLLRRRRQRRRLRRRLALRGLAQFTAKLAALTIVLDSEVVSRAPGPPRARLPRSAVHSVPIL
mmetsp:Transcript_17970/g.62154  ORF Transcript_17970/g.62154 Transcript_17970/m.62154 type:complete len:796 (+) Transcript_17970:1628-4015(+)